MTSSNPSQSQSRSRTCLRPGFTNWISQQRADLEELMQILAGLPEAEPELLRKVCHKTIQHLKDYQRTRSAHHGGDAMSIYTHTSFENSLFWIGGFKPSIYIRLVCSLLAIGSNELGFELLKLVKGERVVGPAANMKGVNHVSESKSGNLGIMGPTANMKEVNHALKSKSGNGGVMGPTINMKEVNHVPKSKSGSVRVMECNDMQVKLIKGLYTETVKSEDMISFRMANLQECMAIEPLTINGYERGVDRALAAHRAAFNGVVVDADELRVKVLKELVGHILTPVQGVHLLVASTRLHLSIHEWGKR